MCREGCVSCALGPAEDPPARTPAAIRPEPLPSHVQRHRQGLGGGANGAAQAEEVSIPWRSAIDALPPHWEERDDTLGLASESARSQELRFCSRRRAVPETAAALRRRPLPLQAPPPQTEPVQRAERPKGWPANIPARPIKVADLFKKGQATVDRFYSWGAQASAAVASDLAATDGAASDDGQTGPPETLVIFAREFHDWVHTVPGGMDTTDVEDCVPAGWRDSPGSLFDCAKGDIDVDLIREWARGLESPDEGMLSQLDGAISESRMCGDSVCFYHHKGFRLNAAPAAELTATEEAAGRVSRGSAFPQLMPFRSVAYNCFSVPKYKMINGALTTKLKWRVTTDDSIVADGSDSRNTTIDKSLWPDTNLCAIQHLAEAVAMMRTARSPEALEAIISQSLRELSKSSVPWEACERIVLWALDLSDAYRMVAVHWSEHWQQGFIWADGFRVNYRCLFGAAHMVGFFQRISMQVKARGDEDCAMYDAMLPPAATTRAWMRHWAQRVAGYSMMYIDDALGASFLGVNSRMLGAHRTSATLGGVESRPQGHQRLRRQRFSRAGWRIALEKVEIDWRIVGLGIGVDTGDDPACEHEGDLFCPEAKRLGMLNDVSELLPVKGESLEKARRRSVPRGPIDKLVGRLGNIGQIEPAARPLLAPCFAVVSAGLTADKKHKKMRKKAKAAGEIQKPPKQRKPPRRLYVHGDGPTQVLFQDAMAWWQAALARGISVPLAAERAFPPIDAPGVVAMLTDAAREDGTGVGGYAPIKREGEEAPSLLYVSEAWPDWALRALQSNAISMPGGEGFGVVAVLDALLGELEGASHVYVFTDCDAVKAAINGEASGSPQLNELVRWLLARYPHLQLLAFHQPGKRNRAADGLSRDGHGGELARTILDEASQAGMVLRELQLSETAWELFGTVALLPQRAERGAEFLRPAAGQ